MSWSADMLKKLKLTPSRNLNYKKGQVSEGDRYVSIRNEEQLHLANHLLTSDDIAQSSESPATKQERETKLKFMQVKSSDDLDEAVCSYRRVLQPTVALRLRYPAKVLYSCSAPPVNVKRSRRYIEKSPERILDAPGISDNFYASLTDWSYSNVVAVALGHEVYLWDADKGDAELLTKFDENGPVITLVKWSQEGKYLSVGLSDGTLKIYDPFQQLCLRTINAQTHRIACAGWLRNGTISYGTRAGRIYHHDVRERHSLISIFEAHTLEVCGLQWSDDERYLTSGGADAQVNVWENRQVSADCSNALHKLSGHTAAVKAIQYASFLGLGSRIVATGGGTNDHTVKLWNLNSGRQIYSQDTLSQISAILFNKSYKEMITGHGNPESGVRVWRYNFDKAIFEHAADLKSHGGRVLGLCQNPDASYVMSTSDDESMRLWSCWKTDSSQLSSFSDYSENSSHSSVGTTDHSAISNTVFRVR